MTIPTQDEQAAFSARAEPHRRELRIHCYRMLGSFDEAEDQVQETFLRAWRARDSFAGKSSFRAWMYRIATNSCLDALGRRTVPADAADIPWLQPFPDALLPSEEEPDAVVVARETIELAFLAAVQLVPPRQRAVLILRDVLDWPAKDAADLLETSVASVNSALQRARATLREHLPERRLEWSGDDASSERDRALVQRYLEASERGDAAALAALLRDDARFSMPPDSGLFIGREAILACWTEGGFGTPEFGDIRCLVTAANRQPAVAYYARKPGDDAFRAFALDVLRIEGGEITDIVAFPVSPAFGLPPTL